MTAALPQYGYAHKARVVRAGAAEGSYAVEVPALAPGVLSGPFMSAVRDLEAGDTVLVLQVGIGGDYVIVARLPEREPDFTLPIGIGDVTGLAAALDDRATDAELAAAQDANNLNFLVVNSKNTEQDGRLTAIEGVDTTQNGRLTSIEGVNTTQDGRLTSAEGRLTTNETNIAANAAAATEANTWRANQDHDADIYGDAVHFGLPAAAYLGSRAMSNGTAYLSRTRVRKAGSISIVRVAVASAGTGAGTTTAGLYRASSATGVAGPYTLLGSASSALASTGIQSIAVGAQNLAIGDWLVLVLLPLGYTNPPTHAATATALTVNGLLNRSANNVRSAKALSSLPATVSPGDGTWGAQAQPWYCALA